MISPRWRKVARDVWLHKSRSALVIAAICVGIIGAGSVLNAWSLLRRATIEEFAESRPASATLRVDSLNDDVLRIVEAMPVIERAHAARFAFGSIQTPGGNRTASLVAKQDFANNAIGIIEPQAGSWPPKDGDIAVERSSVEFAGISIGDSLMVQLGESPPVKLRMSAIVHDVGVAPGWMDHVVYIYLTPATLERLGAPRSMNRLQVLVRDRSLDRAGVQAVAREVQRTLERSGNHVRETHVPVPGKHVHSGQINSLLLTQGAFALLALLLSGVLVVNLVAAMLAGQVREIGIMKAIGGSGLQIAAMYLALATGFGAVASMISIPVALLLGRAYATFTADLLNFDVNRYAIPQWSVVLQLAVGMLIPLAAAAIPVRQGCRISVSEALRDSGISGRADGGAGRLFSSVSGFSRPLLLSLRNAFRKRQRMVLTLATLSIGGAAYIGALNLRRSIADSIDLLFAPQQYDMQMRFAVPHSADSVVGAALVVPGVRNAEGWSSAAASLVDSDGTPGNRLSILAPPIPTPMLALKMESGRWLSPGVTNEIIINRRTLADEPQLHVGGDVALLIAGKRATWKIVGVTETGPAAVAIMSRDALAAFTGHPEVTSIVVLGTPKSHAERLALVRRVRNAMTDAGFDVASAGSVAQERQVIEDHLQLVAGFLGDMSLLMVLVGGLALASTMSLSVLERTREIGVLRAIGARHGAILAMVQIEGLVIAVLSWLVALPLSLPMSVAVGSAFGRAMFEVPVRWVPLPSAVLLWLVVVILVSVLSCAWPAFRATRITTASALAS